MPSASHLSISKLVSSATGIARASTQKPTVDHSANVILFGVPKIPLSDTKSFIDEVLVHMIGHSVGFRVVLF